MKITKYTIVTKQKQTVKRMSEKMVFVLGNKVPTYDVVIAIYGAAAQPKWHFIVSQEAFY